MIEFDEKLLRTGFNQLGVLAMAAGLVGAFIGSEGALRYELYLIAAGLLLFAASALRLKLKPEEKS